MGLDVGNRKKKRSNLGLPIPEMLTYIEKLLKGKREAGFVICGSFGLHKHDGLLEDLLVPNICLNQSSEARNNSLCLFIELGKKSHKYVHHNIFILVFLVKNNPGINSGEYIGVVCLLCVCSS